MLITRYTLRKSARVLTLTLDITQDGDDNVVNLSFSHDDNTVTIVQEGEDTLCGLYHIWGSGQAWGGDLDGSDNNLNIKQYCNQTGMWW